ncbi:MarR family winged helix-turn-helix transcriptional regulator [Sphingomonas sp. PL-96]|uniref:MarR family winged helix-turn-helix transcriptional regulator n=1 Tax=Sphingomonas sp. PL-96 TaxID=2887201 RepID=UPI001E55FE91|nr:MarR family winged helix-turn-helix transcriptional regulator [Sphingomonas sp. PL-96]MCC2976075.1 MarR family winged helix-turn-helix transcriptional regulator [Sphingomonas sp. PL-96]
MAAPDDLISDFGRLFLRLRRIADAQLAREGVSLARMKLLMHLNCKHSSARAADIASFFGYSPRTVSEAIEGLERDGLVQRVPDPLDGRVKRISLTPEGQAVITAAEPLRTQLNQTIFGVLDAEEKAQLREILAKLAGAADGMEREGGLEAWPSPSRGGSIGEAG